MILIALLVTALYYLRIFSIGEQSSTSVSIMEQLQCRTPLRILTLTACQQIMSTFFCWTYAANAGGDQRGLGLASLIFSFSHLFGVLIDNPLSFAALVTGGSFFALLIWGICRIRWQSPWASLALHYLFYLSWLLGKAWGWL